MEKIFFITLLVIAVIGIMIGFSTLGVSFNNAMPIISTNNTKSQGGFFASAFAAVETTWSSTVGQFLISFDNFKNVHQIILDKESRIRVYDVDPNNRLNEVYVSTDKGLFLSRDGGLTFNRFISSNNEIDKNTNVFKVLSASSNGEDYFISVFKNGKGYVYRTYDYFFNLEALIDFDNEAPYDMYRTGNSLYLAVSNGQIIHFNLKTKESRVVNVFSSPILKIQKSPNGGFYLLSKSGVILKGNSLEGKFVTAKTPGGGWLFSGSPVGALHFDSNGNMYILNSEGIYVSYNNGNDFTLLKQIPIQKKQIDAMGINNGKIYAISGTRLFTSSNGGTDWKIDDLDNEFKITRIFFMGPKVIMSM